MSAAKQRLRLAHIPMLKLKRWQLGPTCSLVIRRFEEHDHPCLGCGHTVSLYVCVCACVRILCIYMCVFVLCIVYMYVSACL
jgi:hypothetical protein